MSGRLQRLLPVFLFIIALGLLLPRLDYPEKYLFDEILFAYTAGEYTEGNAAAFSWDHPCSVFKGDVGCLEAQPEAQQIDRVGKYQWDHPPLGKHIISLGILLFGNDAFGWRISSAVVGAIGVVLAYQLGVKLTNRRIVGALAGGLLLLDGLYFVYSRMGLVDIYVTVIMLAAVLMFADYLMAPPDRIRWPLFATGVLLGMGIGTKWNAGYLAALIGMVVLVRFVRLLLGRWRGDTSPQTRRGIIEHMIWIPLSLGIVPLAVYLLTFTQFFLEGYTIEQFIQLQRETFHVHSTIRDGNVMASRWWEWPLALRHVWFGNRVLDDGRIATTYALGNPLLYWAFLPAVAWLCIHWWRRRNPGLILLVVGFFGQWLPWMFVERSTYTYHFLPAVPFGCLAVAMAVIHLCQRGSSWQRTLAIEYVVLVALTFAFFYPMFAFLPMSEEALALRMWLPPWR
ncbi:MAG: phospholipid carrier-dependent glycosyltransferase [Chloroflexota bacterium]|nr:phospholipid carrier-dependent glycosyltransferase [Chloroflexota bacterium]